MIDRRASSFSMDAVMFQSSQDQFMYPHRSQIKNPKTHAFISRSYENYHHQPTNVHKMGLLQAPQPPVLSQSYPPYSFQQPPLLPLPVATQRRGNPSRGLSYPAVNKRIIRDSSVTPKKSNSNSPNKSFKKEEKFSPKKCVTVTSNGSFGPDNTKHVSNSVTKVLPFGSFNDSNANNGIGFGLNSVEPVKDDEVDVFSGSSVFTTISPPPSSLPLPTFSLRPKLSCNAQAAARIDTGATDDLRRLLRLP